MKKIGNAFIFFILMSVAMAWAQEVQVQATVDRTQVGVGDTFTVTVTVQSNESVQVEEPHLPQISGFELVQQWENTSVQQSLSSTPNGMDWKTVRKNNFHYTFQATAVGRYSVDSFEVVVNGKIHRTQPIVMEISAEGQGATAQAPSRRPRIPSIPGLDEEEERFLQEQEEIFNQLLQRRLGQLPTQPSQRGQNQSEQAEPQYRSMPTNSNEAFFIQVEIDKKSVYEGEQVTVTWYLLTRGQMESLDRVKFPNLKGFWKEIIEENPQIQFSEEIINGVVYRKALLASHALFPIKPGKATIDEFIVKSRVRMPTQGFGYGFNFGRPYTYTKSSKKVDIEVKPLPTEGRPPQFTGAVGNFDVIAAVEGQQFLANQPFTLKVRFEGQGNAKSIEMPKIEWPEGLEYYDAKSESRFFKDGRSFKAFEILLIPRKTGTIEIPPVEFAFFNTQSEKYESKKTEAIKLDISGAAQLAQDQSGSFMGQSAAPKRVLSLPALIEAPVGFSSAVIGSMDAFWGSAYLFAALALIGLGWKELRPQNRTLSLRKKLDKHWKKVEKAQSENSPRQLGAEIVNAFNFVLSEITSHRGEILEINKMLEKLSPQLRKKYGSLILEAYENAQLLSFAPESVVEEASRHKNLPDLVKNSRQVLYVLCDNQS